jgi:tetratricopeptide (TPR) repeat protein
LSRLLGFLDSDPKNLGLLADAAGAAFEAQDFDLTAALIERHAAIAPPPASLINLQGLIALIQQRFDDAAAIFGALRRQGANDPGLRFNLAWAKAMTGDWQESLDLLDDDAVAVSPRAPSLKIQAMHHLGLYEEALAAGAVLAERFADDQALMGALATLALDAEKPELARHYALKAGDTAEGNAALGVLTLGAYDAAGSLPLFERAIAEQPRNPRAWVGKGLSLLAAGDSTGGASAIDRGAELFGDHLGSWIASGWAHFATGDMAGARASFERALAIDANFSESHGGLAVMDILDGRIETAQRQCEIALRLDKKSFGGALAKMLLLQRSGHAELAQKIRDAALNTPIGPDGQTIIQALAGFSGAMKR